MMAFGILKILDVDYNTNILLKMKAQKRKIVILLVENLGLDLKDALAVFS